MCVQMDYNFCLVYVLVVNVCYEMIKESKIGVVVLLFVIYFFIFKLEDVYVVRMNDNFKVYYMFDMYYYGEYLGYYMKYFEKRNIVFYMEDGDKEIFKKVKMDFIVVNYYRINCVEVLFEDL